MGATATPEDPRSVLVLNALTEISAFADRMRQAAEALPAHDEVDLATQCHRLARQADAVLALQTGTPLPPPEETGA